MPFFRKFDQPKLWENAIAYDELNLIRRTIQLSGAPEDDLEKFTRKSLNSMLDCGSAPWYDLARSGTCSVVNYLFEYPNDGRLAENRRIIDEKIELFQATGWNLTTTDLPVGGTAKT